MHAITDFWRDESGASLIDAGIALGAFSAVAYVPVYKRSLRNADILGWLTNVHREAIWTQQVREHWCYPRNRNPCQTPTTAIPYHSTVLWRLMQTHSPPPSHRHLQTLPFSLSHNNATLLQK